MGNTQGKEASERLLAGSSPRLWGTLMEELSQWIIGRFIPTLVGNTALAPITIGSPAVHPHACGEHTFKIIKDMFVFGSSPRLWGTQPPVK